MDQVAGLTFDSRLLAYFEGQVDEARDLIERYFDEDPGQEGYTGSQFEYIADSDHPNEITERDMVAITMLDTAGGRVRVPPRVAVWMLRDGRDRISELLTEIPSNKDLWEVTPDVIAREGHAWKLWDLLREGYWPEPRKGNGVGSTIASKLLAAKRPRLLPIMDDDVTTALGKPANFWSAMRNCLADEDNRHIFDEATDNRPERVSLLRAIDIVVWMNEQTKTSPTGS